MIEITTDPITLARKWVITIKRDEIFTRVSVTSVYINSRLPLEQRSVNREMSDSDRLLFDKYFREAISDVLIIMTRYFQEEFSGTNENESGDIVLNVCPTTLMPDSISYALDGYIVELFEKVCLKKWFGQDSGPLGIDKEYEQVVSKLMTTIHYRRKGLTRPIGPLF